MPEPAFVTGAQWWLSEVLLACSAIVFCMNALLYSKLSRKRETFLRQLGTGNGWHTRAARLGFVLSYGTTILVISLLGFLHF